MTCPFLQDDAAYVLGALAPAERLAYERHLPDCAECTRAVSELAGMPGLLGRVDASVVEASSQEKPVPDTLLPAMTRAVRRARRRRSVAAAGLVAAVLLVVVPLSLWLGGRESTDPGAPTDAATAVESQDMAPVGDVPVRALLTLQSVAWGTKLGLACTYEPGSSEYDTPSAVRYTLFVTTKDGRTEQVGSWRAEAGRTMTITSGTAETLEHIASVEVRLGDDRVVLRSGA